jgi:hypothetical protein
LISAFYHIGIQSDGKSFSVQRSDGEIKPGESEVFALLDDTIMLTEKMTIFVEYRASISLEITAKGNRTALVSSIKTSEIDFDYVFTGEPIAPR